MSEKVDLVELTPEEQRKFRARMRGMTIFCLLLAVPIGIGAYLVWRVQARIAEDKAWAQAELQKPRPSPFAYGAMGSILLNEGKVAEALPLLKKASDLEAAEKTSAKAHLIYAEAHLEGLKRKLPEARKEAAVAAIQEMLAYTSKLPQGRAAAAWHGAGKLYQHLGMKAEGLECLKKASEMQPDDWVEEGPGLRYKHKGLSSAYQKDYSGALQQ